MRAAFTCKYGAQMLCAADLQVGTLVPIGAVMHDIRATSMVDHRPRGSVSPPPELRHFFKRHELTKKAWQIYVPTMHDA